MTKRLPNGVFKLFSYSTKIGEFSMSKSESSVTRSEEAIAQQVEEVETLFSEHSDFLSRIFTRKGVIETLFIFIVTSLGFYVLALLAALIEFDGMTPSGFTTDNIEVFFDFTDEGWGIDMHFMPLYLFIHLVMVVVIGKSMCDAVAVIPRVIDLETAAIERNVRKMQTNLSGLLIALPFILYDAYFTFQEVSDSEAVMINPLVHWIVCASWTLEWWIFGAVISSLIKYLFFIRRITAKYSYEANILPVIVKGELDPLIRLGWRLTIALGLFLVTNVAYTIYYGFWPTDFIGLIIIFIMLPVLTVVPLQLIERDVAYEQGLIADRFLDKYVDHGIGFIKDPKSISLESKIDILVGRRLLQTFVEHKRETLKVYLRMATTMAITAGGLVFSYYEQILDFIDTQDISAFSEGVILLLRILFL
jgi:hypothetical protein